MIRFQNVSATIQGNRILDNINLAINDGEFVLLCGESGCGKTALTRLVNGLIPHFVKDVEIDGTVMVEDMKISDSPNRLVRFSRTRKRSFSTPIPLPRLPLGWRTSAQTGIPCTKE